MRTTVAGVARTGEPLRFDYAGQRVEAWPGETVASALIAAGIWHFRETREGEERGPYCGMGVCGECTVLVNGEPRKACLEAVRADLVVAPQPARTPVSENAAAPALAAWEILHCDVLVVGAGPAGLAAAAAAAASGAEVLLVDERAKAGGQYFKQPGTGFAIDEQALDSQFREGRGLYDAAVAQDVRFLFGATVWGTFGPDEVGIVHEGRAKLIKTRQLILSPGAYERPLPVPGWTLPGVLTTGAAQTFLRAYQTAPGQRVLVAGNGPLNLQVARELTRAGVTVVAVAELAAAPGIAQWQALSTMASSSPALVAAGIGHVLALRRAGVPVLYRHVLKEAEGEEHVRRATLMQVDAQGEPIEGSECSFDVDAVCLGYGFLPQAELARALGCAHRVESGGALAVERQLDGSTSVAGVYVAGDAGTLGGARVAIAQGTLAGCAAAAALGLSTAPYQARIRAAQRQAARHLRFQKALWTVYAARYPGLQLAKQDTIVCRCESVSKAQLDRCFAAEMGTLGAVKRETRAGMGRCQGRYCSGLLAEMAAAAGHAASEEGDFFAPRTPFKPISIGSLAVPAEGVFIGLPKS
jgi:NADPH-dependent 2,4-dienoyl-CoA reductase/sulfur reductase-like enzyme